MEIAPSPAMPYAVLRVDRRKAKAKGGIAAASAHQMRQRPTANADAGGPAPTVLHLAAGATPYQAACMLLDGAERRNRETVLCREVVLSASPSYFRPGREHRGGEFEPSRMQAWATSSLAWARRQWPDQLASFVLHLDEVGAPHAHLLVVPRVRTTNGGWKLNSKALFDREQLRSMQTTYGAALAPLGIRRGEPGSKATHSEVRQFYGAIHRANLAAEQSEQPAPPKPVPPLASVLERAMEPLLEASGIETERQRKKKIYEADRRAWMRKMREHREKENQRIADLEAVAAMAPLRRRQRESKGIAESLQPHSKPRRVGKLALP